MLGLSLALLLPLMTGCVEREVEGEVVKFSFATWAQLTVLLVGLAAAPVGIALKNASGRAPWIGIIVSIVMLLVLLPGQFLDYAKVDATHFEGRYGIWVSPTKFDIKYADLSHIDNVIYETRGRRGRKNTKNRLDCVMKSGERQKVELGDMMKEARDDILTRAEAAGVEVRDVDERK